MGAAEGGIRVPGILRWPEVVKPGIEIDAPTSLLDFWSQFHLFLCQMLKKLYRFVVKKNYSQLKHTLAFWYIHHQVINLILTTGRHCTTSSRRRMPQQRFRLLRRFILILISQTYLALTCSLSVPFLCFHFSHIF